MGFLHQLGLVLGKNFTLLARQPVVFSLVLVWPLVVVILLAVVRQAMPPQTKPECSYSPRSTPSSGILPFLQSTVCSINNKCENDQNQESVTQARERMSELMSELLPLISNPQNISMITNMSDSLGIIKTISDLIYNDNLTAVLNGDYRLRSFLRDPDAVLFYLVHEVGILDDTAANALMNASINLVELLKLTTPIDFRGIVCNPQTLASYLLFDLGADVQTISAQLCATNADSIPDIVQLLQQQLDVRKIFDVAARLTNALGGYTIAAAFNDTALLIDVIGKLNILGTPRDVYDILVKVSELLRGAGPVVDMIYEEIVQGRLNLSMIVDAMSQFDPLVATVMGNNSTIWNDVKNVLRTGQCFVDYVVSSLSSLSGRTVKLSDIWNEPQKLMESLSGYIDADVVNQMMAADVDYDKLVRSFLSTVGTNNTSARLLCSPSLVEVLSSGSNLTALRVFQDQFCSQNITVIENEIFNKFGLEFLKLFTLISTTVQTGSLNATCLGQMSLADTMATLGRISRAYLPIVTTLTEVPLTSIWMNVIRPFTNQMVTVGARNTSTERWVQLVFESVYNTLINMTTDGVTISNGLYVSLGLANTTITAINDALNVFETLPSHWALNASIKSLVDLQPSPEAAGQVLDGFLTPAMMQVFLKSPNDIQMSICNFGILRNLLQVPQLDLSSLSKAMCTPDFGNLIIGAFNMLNVSKVVTEMDYIMKDNTTDPKALLWGRIMTVMSSVDALTLGHSRAVDAWWSAFVRADTDHVTNTTIMAAWHQHAESLTANVQLTRLIHVMSVMGPKVEENFPGTRPYILAAVVTAKKMLTIMKTQNLDVPPFSNLSNYAVYFPAMMEAIVTTLADPIKSLAFVSLIQSPAALCIGDGLRAVVNFPATVPYDAIMMLMCQTNFTQWAQDFARTNDWSQEQSLWQSYFTPGASLPPIHWDEVIQTAMDIYSYARKAADQQTASGLFIGQFGNMATALMNGLLANNQSMTITSMSADTITNSFELIYTKTMDTLMKNNVLPDKTLLSLNLSDLIVVEMTQKLESIRVSGLRADSIFIGNFEAEIHAMMSIVPNILELIVESLNNPTQLSIRLRSLGNCSAMECHWLHTLLPNADPSQLTILEAAMTNNSMDTAQQLLQTPIVQRILTLVQSAHNNTQIITYNASLYIQHSRALSQVINALVTGSVVIFPDIPDFNMTRIHTAISNIMKMPNMSLINYGRQQYEDSLNMLMTLTQNTSLDATQQFVLKTVTSLMKAVNINLALSSGMQGMQLIKSAELDKLIKAVNGSSSLMKIIADSIRYWITRPEMFIQKFADPMIEQKLCFGSDYFKTIFLSQGSTDDDMHKLQSVICGNISVKNLSSELLSSIDWLNDLMALLNQNTTTPNQPTDLREFVAVLVNFTDQLTMFTQRQSSVDVTVIFDGLIKSPIWKDIQRTLVDTEMDVTGKSVQSFISGFTSGLLTLLMRDAAVAEQLNPVLHVINAAVLSATQHIRMISGTNTTQINEAFPEMSKILTLISHDYILANVVLVTLTQSPDRLSSIIRSRDPMKLLCAQPDSVLYIPPDLPYNTSATIDALCTLNVTKLYAEIIKMSGSNTMAMNVSDTSAVNVTEFLVNSESLRTAVMDLVNSNGSYLMAMGNAKFNNWQSMFARVQPYLETIAKDTNKMMNLSHWLVIGAIGNSLNYYPELNGYLTAQRNMYDAMSEYLARFVGQNVSLATLFQHEPELLEVTKILNDYPDLLLITVLSVMMKPEQWSRTLPTLTMESFCNQTGQDLFVPRVGLSDPQEIIAKVCAINITSLVYEVMHYTDINVTKIWEESVNTTVPLDVAGYVQSQMRLHALVSGLNTSNFMPLIHSFDQFVAEEVWRKFPPTDELMSLALESMLMVPVMQLSQIKEASAWLQIHMIVNELIYKAVKGLVAQNRTFDELVDDVIPASEFPSLNRVTHLNRYLLPVIEVLVTNSHQLPRIANMFSNFTSICLPNATAFLNMTTLQSTVMAEVFDTLCSLDNTTLFNETSTLLELNQITMENHTVLDVTRYTRSLVNLIGIMRNSTTAPLGLNMTSMTWLRTSAWAELMDQLRHMSAMSSQAEYLLSVAGDLAQNIFANLPDMKQYSGYINVVNYLLDQVIERVSYMNHSAAAPADIFTDAPELQKIINMLPILPQVTDVLLHSYNTPKFAPIIRAENATAALDLICNPSINISDYLTVPPNTSNIDLDRLKARFCVLKMEDLKQEISVVFGAENITRAFSDPTLVNITTVLMKAMKSANLLRDLVNVNETTWVFAQSWMDPTVWLDILKRAHPTTLDKNDITRQIGMALAGLLPLFENDTTAQLVGNVLDVVVKSLLNNSFINDPYFSFDVLAQNVPQLKLLHDLLANHSAAAVSDFSRLFMNDVDKLIKLASGPEPMGALCSTDQIVIDSELRQILCQFNESSLLYELSQFMDTTLGERLRNLTQQSSPSGPLDWGALYQNVLTLVDKIQSKNVTALLTPPRGIDAQFLQDLRLMMESLGAKFTTGDTSPYMSLVQVLFHVINDTTLNNALSLDSTIYELINSLLDSITVDNKTIDLKLLFQNTDQLRQMLETTLNMTPRFIQAFMSLPVRIEKVIPMVINIINDAGWMSNLTCDTQLMRQYFILDDSMAADMRTLFCLTNYTAVMTDIMQLLHVPTIMSVVSGPNKPVNMSRFFQSVQEYTSRVMALSNVTSVMYGDLLLSTYFNITFDEQTTLLWLIMNLPPADVTTFGNLLQQLMPTVEQTDFWVTLRPHLDAVNFIADIINNKMMNILMNTAGQPITLDAIFSNSSHFKNMVRLLRDITPELLYVPVNVTKLMFLNMSDPVRDFLCNGGLMIDVMDANMTSLHTSLCNNLTDMVMEMAHELSVPEIISMLRTLYTNPANNSQTFNWTTTLTNMEELAQTSTAVFSVIAHEMPDIVTFLRLDGNVSSFMTQFVQGMTAPATNPAMAIERASKYLGVISELLSGLPNGNYTSLILHVYGMGLTSLNKQLLQIQNQSITLASLLMNATKTRNMLETVTGPNLLATFDYMLSSVTNVTELASVLMGTSGKNLTTWLCESNSTLESIFYQMPNSTTTSAVRQFWCDLDQKWPEIHAELVGQFDIDRIVATIRSESPLNQVNMTSLWQTAITETVETIKLAAMLNGTNLAPDDNLMKLFDVGSWYINSTIQESSIAWMNRAFQVQQIVASIMDQYFMDNPYYQHLLQNFRMQTYVNKYLMSVLKIMTTDNVTLTFSKLFADDEAMKNILSDLLDAKTIAEFSLAVISPNKYLDLLSQPDMTAILCSAETFSTYFSFPPAVNVTSIRTSLCTAASTKPLILADLFRRLDIQSLLSQLSNQTNSTLNGRTIISDYTRAYTQLQYFWPVVTALRPNLTQINYFKQAVDVMIGTVNTTLSPVCELMNTSTSPVMTSVWAALNLGVTLMEKMPAYITFLNNFPNTSANQFVSFVKDNQLAEMMSSIANIDKLGPVDCASVNMRINQVIPQMIANSSQLMSSLQSAMVRLIQTNLTFFQFIDQGLLMCQEAMVILSDSRMADLVNWLNVAGLTPQMLQTFLSGLTRTKPVFIKLDEILKNDSSIEGVLRTFTNMSSTLIMELLNSTIGIDIGYFVNMTQTDLDQLLCNETMLRTKLSLPYPSSFNYSDLAIQLCSLKGRIPLTEITSYFDFGKLFVDMIVNQTTPNDLVSLLTTDFMDVLNKTGSLFKLADLVKGVSLENLTQLLPEIQRFVMDNNPESVFDSLTKFVTDFASVSPDPQFHAFIDDISAIANGVKAMNYFKQLFPFNVRLLDLLKQPSEVKDFLMSRMNMTETSASILLNASFSYAQLMNMSQTDIVDRFCDPTKLSTILLFGNGTNVTDISRQLCAVNRSTAADVLQYIITNLSVGEYIKKLVTLNIGDLLDNSNVSLDALKNAFDNFRPMKDIYQNILATLQPIVQNLSTTTPPSIGTPQTMALSQTEALGQAICGDKQSLKFADAFSVGSAVTNQGEILTQDDLTPVMTQELNSIEGESCKSLYKSIHNMTGGAIIWSYIKPLLMGKVLYSPVNDQTKIIMGQANSVFDQLSSFLVLMKAVTNTVHTAQGLKSDFAVKFKEALENPLVSRLFQGGADLSMDSLTEGLNMLSALRSEDVYTMVQYMDSALTYSPCISLTTRFQGYPDEDQMISNARTLSDDNNLLAGVVFMNMPNSTSSRKKRSVNSATLPKQITYKIRLDVDNTPDTQTITMEQWMSGPQDNFAQDLRYLRNFIPLQDMIDRAIISAQVDGQYVAPVISTQQFPYPCRSDDNFLKYSNSFLLPILMVVCWLVFVSIGVKLLVSDRETGLEETMRLMGLSAAANFIAWFFTILICMAVVDVLFVLVLKLGQLLPYSDPIVLFLFILIFSISILMLSYMVSAFFTTTVLASLVVVIVYLISYIPFMLIRSKRWDQTMEFWQQMLAMIPCCSAFSFGASYIARFESAGVGIQWYNLNEAQVPFSGSFAWCCCMIFVDIVGYFIIGWYFRNVLPGKFGLAQPWYFPVSPRYWRCGCCVSSRRQPTDRDVNNVRETNFTNLVYDPNGGDPDEFGHERGGEQRRVGVKLHHLTKKYNKHRVVDDVTAEFYVGDITAFVGHNGAGKTTTINMLCGLYAPSSGSAYVNGRNVVDDWRNAMHDIGICPQYNILYETMTIEEHLRFFASLKGTASREAINSMLSTIGLWDMRQQKVSTLSGGMKRRLSVALAFIGGASTVILDEPTSGVDPSARRLIWELIMKYKHDRTIIFTTHHMEEADIIGDRILVINKGKILCSGSPIFLKRQFGRGYDLTLTKKKSAATDKIMSFIKERQPNSYLNQETGDEMSVILPTNNWSASNFRDFFAELSDNLNSLEVTNFAISDTSLDDVFVGLCRLSDSGLDVCRENLQILHKEEDPDHERVLFDEVTDPEAARANDVKEDLQTGFVLACRQLLALFTKRLHHHKRFIRGLASHIILPCVLVALAAWATSSVPDSDNRTAPLLLSPALYAVHDRSVFYSTGNESVYEAELEKALLSQPGLGTTCMDAGLYNYSSSNGAVRCLPDDTIFTMPQYNTADAAKWEEATCSCQNNRQVCTAGANYYPVPSGIINPGAAIYNLTGQNITEYLLRTNAQFFDTRFGGWQLMSTDATHAAAHKVVTWFNNRGPHALPVFYNSMSNMLLRQAVSQYINNSQPADYGITVYNSPLQLTKKQLSVETLMSRATSLGIALILICALSFIPAGFLVFPVMEHVNQEKRLQFVYGLSAFTYWMAQLIWDMTMWLIPTGLILLILWLFNVDVYVSALNLPATAVLLVLYGWAVLPICYLCSSCFRDAGSAFMVIFTAQLFTGLIALICTFLLSLFVNYSTGISIAYTILRYIFLALPPFVLGDGFIELMRNQILASLLSAYGQDTYVSPFTFEMLGWHYVALGAVGLVALILTIIVDTSSTCCTSRYGRRKGVSSDDMIDSDVLTEQCRISRGPLESKDAVVLDGLRKDYRSGHHRITAVNRVFVGFQKGECFGLLGENGAGKSSIFKILTREEKPTGGRAIILRGSDNAGLEKSVGYCPQFDAIDYQLTGRELLFFYAKLKGVRASRVTRVVEQVVINLKMGKFADKVCGKYSGGMRRRLSVAVALVTDPMIVLLDEPTAGMDVQSRRLVWSILRQHVARDRCVIVTSHRMNECEKACTRLCIMVNGQLKCLGSPQHLKCKYGEGYTVLLQLTSQDKAAEAIATMIAYFPDSVLKDHRHRIVEMSIPYSAHLLGDIFGTLEAQRERMGLVDFSVTQTSLDQIFVDFCRRQTDGVKSSAKGLLDANSTPSSSTSSGSHPDIRPGFHNAAHYPAPVIGINGDEKPEMKKQDDISIPMLRQRSSQEHYPGFINPIYDDVANPDNVVTIF